MSAFTTHLSLGQTGYSVQRYTHCDFHVVPLTVGKIMVEQTDPRCKPDWSIDPLFQEKYMCVETGIGSGSIWEYGLNIFATEADAQAGVIKHEQRAHKERALRDAYEAEQRAKAEERDRQELERLKAKYEAQL